jgi:hypothetical protein
LDPNTKTREQEKKARLGKAIAVKDFVKRLKREDSEQRAFSYLEDELHGLFQEFRTIPTRLQGILGIAGGF